MARFGGRKKRPHTLDSSPAGCFHKLRGWVAADVAVSPAGCVRLDGWAVIRGPIGSASALEPEFLTEIHLADFGVA